MTYKYNTINSKTLKLQVNASPTFVDAFNSLYSLLEFPDYNLVLTECERLVRSENPKVAQEALSNVRGLWYQWLIGLSWRHYNNINPKPLLLVKLPNKNASKWHRLYEKKITQLIDELENKIAKDNISLETSNPDFVILEVQDSKRIIYDMFLTTDYLSKMDNEYLQHLGAVMYGALPAFLSIKTSLRPDRRLQTQFEATMIKALQAYLATRQWDLTTPSSNFYVVVNATPNKEDFKSLSALAAHSLVIPLVKPQKLVDLLIQVNNYKTAEDLFNLL